MSDAESKVLSCFPDPPIVERRDLQRQLIQRSRCHPDESGVIKLFFLKLKLVFARLPFPMDMEACAVGALSMVKAIFKHFPAQVAPAIFKLGCSAWMLAPNGAELMCPFCIFRS
jgi:hypothetical protein